jgi:hypothetical protein
MNENQQQRYRMTIQLRLGIDIILSRLINWRPLLDYNLSENQIPLSAAREPAA